MCADTAAVDYRDTVFLPETAFPMRAGLPQREPEWLARWARIGVAALGVAGLAWFAWRGELLG